MSLKCVQAKIHAKHLYIENIRVWADVGLNTLFLVVDSWRTAGIWIQAILAGDHSQVKVLGWLLLFYMLLIVKWSIQSRDRTPFSFKIISHFAINFTSGREAYMHFCVCISPFSKSHVVYLYYMHNWEMIVRSNVGPFLSNILYMGPHARKVFYWTDKLTYVALTEFFVNHYLFYYFCCNVLEFVFKEVQ